MNMIKIFEVLKNEFEENFDKYKNEEYTLAEYCAIPFFNKGINYREVNNWGTEEDTDFHLLFFPEGWKLGTMTVQVGAGINKVVENNIHLVSEKNLDEWFQKQTNVDQMKIVVKAYKILEKSGKLHMIDEI